MACGDYNELIDAVGQGAAQDFVTCAFISDMGPHIWPLFVVGALMVGAFGATRSAVPPVILMLLLGPFVVATMPAAGGNLLGVGALFVLPSVLILLLLRFKQARP